MPSDLYYSLSIRLAPRRWTRVKRQFSLSLILTKEHRESTVSPVSLARVWPYWSPLEFELNHWKDSGAAQFYPFCLLANQLKEKYTGDVKILVSQNCAPPSRRPLTHRVHNLYLFLPKSLFYNFIIFTMYIYKICYIIYL